MTPDDHALDALGPALAPVDLDPARAARIAERARRQLGRGASPARLLEPIAVTAATLAYLGWAIARVIDALR